jgi:hypothetical protein
MTEMRVIFMNGVNESDWKLFRKKLPGWQEAYMEKLTQEYAAILAGPGLASEKFWKLEKRINSDKRCTGVIVIGMSRSKMYQHLVSLAYEGVIGPDDLDGFSDELREQLAYVVGKNHKL